MEQNQSPPEFQKLRFQDFSMISLSKIAVAHGKHVMAISENNRNNSDSFTFS